MATLRTRWLLSILLVSLTSSFASADPPAPPFYLECFVPCENKSCSVDIQCTWDHQSLYNYSLHWEPANSEDEHVTSKTTLSEFIHREHFSNHEKLRVWVEAKNHLGSATNQEIVFNTADIIKPPPPSIRLVPQESAEIEWRSFCDDLHFSAGTCDIQIKSDQEWHEHEVGVLHAYQFDGLQSCTVYEFQVRCSCSIGLKSDWSPVQTINGTETAPVGQLDIWWDCGISPASFDCAVTWKKLPISQACGKILGYAVRLFYRNGTLTVLNVSTAQSGGQLSCDAMQCRLTSSLKDVSSVSVSAFNAHGATVPSNLTFPTSGKEKNDQIINLEMNEENLTVSWDPSSLFSDNVKEYVVQYKPACPPKQGFDWVKVNKSQTTVFFKGQFEKYTPFQVSLFTVSHSSQVHHLSSVIGYSFEGTPSTVASFKVVSIAATRVTLFWKPVPLSEQKGVIRNYQIGLDRENVHKEIVIPLHENGTFELNHLRPDQEYEVWIRAVTVAGPGENVTMRFKTKQQENHGLLILGLCVAVVLVVCLCVYFLCYQGQNILMSLCFYEKVPDPSNSHIFRQMKHQINDPLGWICIPYEPHPKISVLEVVEIQPGTFTTSLKKTSDSDELTRPVLEDGCSQSDCQDDRREDAVTEQCGRTDHRYGREEYSKMVDSDEERDREEGRDDCWSSSEEEQFTSGYEKHFMPTTLEILEGQ